MNKETIIEKLKCTLKPKRFEHSLNVMTMSEMLAERYNIDGEKASIAGLLHDCARDIGHDEALILCNKLGVKVDNIMKVQPELLHGPLGSKLIKSQYSVDEECIADAVYYHTTGCENMSLLQKIIFIADYIEPGRKFPMVQELRKAAYENIDAAMIMAFENTIKHVLDNKKLLHPDTVNARNSIVGKII